MQSRTYLRIEGDLVSLISEVIDREVALPDLAKHPTGRFVNKVMFVEYENFCDV